MDVFDSERRARRARVFWTLAAVFGLLFALAAVGGLSSDNSVQDSGERPTARQDSDQAETEDDVPKRPPTALEDDLASAARSTLEDGRVSYRVHQTEFQEAEGSTVWVVQIEDPVDSLSRANIRPADAEPYLLEEPLRRYAEAVAQVWEDLGFVDTYILAYRDPQGTVVEAPRELMGGLVEGQLQANEAAEQVKVSVQTR